MWQRFLESKQSRGEAFSPPVFAVMTEGGLKLIGKRDGTLEVYDLKDNLIENQDLAPHLPQEALEDYRHLLDTLKTETGFHEATAGMLTQAARQAA
jgi:hypothetical protein